MSSQWYVAFALLTVLVLANTLLAVVLLRQIGVLHQRIRPTGAGTFEGPEVGQELPMIPLGVVHGTLSAPLFSQPVTLFVYITPGCSVCRALPDLVRAYLRHEPTADLQVIFATDVPEEPARAHAISSDLPAAMVQSDTLSKTWNLPGSPYVLAVKLVAEGAQVEVLSRGVVNTLEQLEDVIELGRLQALRASAPSAESANGNAPLESVAVTSSSNGGGTRA